MEEKSKHRKTGIDIVGAVPWGTHFCQFYATKQDLLEVLVPYFKAGLKNNEFCMWVTSDPLSVKEAKAAMKKAVPNFEKYMSAGQIEIIPYNEWYTKKEGFVESRVLNDWVLKLEGAISKGFDGLRLTGNTFWIEKKDWKAFSNYEETINNVIGKYKMLAICTYSLEKCGVNEILDVITTHQFALIKRQNKWEIIESSDYRKTKESLQQSEKRLKTYMKVAGQIGWTTNAKGEVEEDVPSWREYTGQTLKEIKGLGWSKALHPDDLKHTVKQWNKSVANQSAYETEYRIRRHDGVYRHFLVRGTPVLKDNGEIQEWVGTCVDITDRKKDEEKIMRLASFPKLNPNPIIELDLSGKVIFNNAAATATLRELNLGKNLRKFLPDDISKIIRTLKQSNKEPVIYREVTIKDRTFAENIYLLKKLGVIRFYSIDITERRKAEEQLMEYMTQLENLNRSLQKTLVKEEALLESIGDGVIALDNELKIIALNRKTEPLFGWKTKNVLGKKLFNQFALEDEKGRIIPDHLRPPQLAIITSRTVHGIYFLIKKGQKSLPLEITSAPVILDGVTVGAISIYRNISQKMAIDKAKDEFVSIASHELRTPLSAIAWSLERLYEDKDYSIRQRKSLDQINRQTQNMINLTNDLLEATKMELDVFPYKYEEVKPLEIASNVATNLKNQIREKKIRFKLIYDKKINVYKTYSNAVYIILHNLLSNAVKFSSTGGKVDLKISKVEKEAEEKLIMQVSDSGVGIPKSAQQKIFQKTYRAENVKGKFAGSGLGLYITKALIDRLGGEISFKSAHNKGTTFTVFLPFVEETKISFKKREVLPNNLMSQVSL